VRNPHRLEGSVRSRGQAADGVEPLARSRASRDSTAWSRLAAAGMVLLGHVHTNEFAAGGALQALLA
jgi:Asp-tRNA(Asn)/Glu-tRNA(Gln) amidotransferase A subunit family amidase